MFAVVMAPALSELEEGRPFATCNDNLPSLLQLTIFNFNLSEFPNLFN